MGEGSQRASRIYPVGQAVSTELSPESSGPVNNVKDTRAHQEGILDLFCPF